MLRIIYIGDSHPGSTSMHRAKALERLGHNVTICDPHTPEAAILKHPRIQMLHYRTGFRFIQDVVCRWLRKMIASAGKPDLVWVDSGEYFGPKAVQLLKTLDCPVILYNIDDPTGRRDGARFRSLKKALPHYDLVIVVRPETELECRKLGAKKVMTVLRSYDEIAHQPYKNTEEIPQEFLSDVAFIGTWMRHEKRDEFLLTLIEKGIPLSIWGNRWSKSPYWNRLSSYYKGGALTGRNYVAAIQGAKVCLGLLSKGNRDLHTTRSMEVPYAGGLFCAERTSDHLKLYEEGKAAMYWSDAEECAKVCGDLLGDDNYRDSVRRAGMERVRKLRVGNEDVCQAILESVLR